MSALGKKGCQLLLILAQDRRGGHCADNAEGLDKIRDELYQIYGGFHSEVFWSKLPREATKHYRYVPAAVLECFLVPTRCVGTRKLHAAECCGDAMSRSCYRNCRTASTALHDIHRAGMATGVHAPRYGANPAGSFRLPPAKSGGSLVRVCDSGKPSALYILQSPDTK